VPFPEDDVPPAPERQVPRKLVLRVNGTRLGTKARPAEPGAVGVAPTRRYGLRVNSVLSAPRVAAVAAAVTPSDYATGDDYE
jgi:hypothetical protein